MIMLRNKSYKSYHIIIGIVLFCFILVSSVWATYLYRTEMERQSEIRDANKLVSSVTRSFEEHTLRAIKNADQIVLFMKYHYEREGKNMDIFPYVNKDTSNAKQLVLLSIADENGNLQLSNQAPFVFSNIKDREHFKVHINNDDGKLYISKPVLGRSSGKWSIQLTRRINNPDGSFGGVVIASLDPMYFTDFYKQVDLGDDATIALIRTDGTINSLEIGQNFIIGKDLYDLDIDLMNNITKSQEGTFEHLDIIDNNTKLYSYVALQDYPLILTIGMTKHRALIEYRLLKDEFYRLSIYISIMISLSGFILILMVRKNRKAEQTLQYIGTHDSLTNILNRYAFEEELTSIINSKKDGVLLFVDLDNFKVINDTFGHTVGDCTLKSVANKLKTLILPSDILARLGGDEFAIILKNVNVDKGIEIAEQIRSKTINTEVKINDIVFNVSMSIGVVPITQSLSSQELLVYADTALYAAKDNGKNRVITIQSFEDKNKMSEANKTIQSIKKAIKENLFVIYFQPIMKVNNNDVKHYEALIRMKSDDGKILAPFFFIPIAEQFGLISQIDKWMLENVLAIMKDKKDINIFLNISGISLSDKTLLDEMEQIIKNSGVEPSRLGFEITETTAIKDLKLSERWIKKLKELGCKFALDDFGVGFSSFSYLHKLPIDYLKIDGSFVKDLNTNPTNRALIKAMNAVAHALGKQTIAEFVENEEILEILEELKVDFGQGYHLGKPEPFDE